MSWHSCILQKVGSTGLFDLHAVESHATRMRVWAQLRKMMKLLRLGTRPHLSMTMLHIRVRLIYLRRLVELMLHRKRFCQ